MATTLADLLSIRTQVQYFQDLMARHKANGVPTSSWLSIVNVGLSLTQIASEVLADLRARISYIAAGLFLETATGARLQSLLFGITTAGFNKEGICYELRDYAIKVLRGYNSEVEGAVKDDTFFAIIFTLDKDDDPFDDELSAPCLALYGVDAEGMPEHIADRATYAEVLKLARSLAPGIGFPEAPNSASQG